MDRDRRVTLLHDLMTPVVEDVAGALMASGTEVVLLEAKDDLDALAAGVRQRRPDLVFNLVERFAGNPRLSPDVAAALDLIGVPYTGAGPPGLYLGADAELAKRLLISYGVAAPALVGPTIRLAVVGNDRLAVFPAGESLTRVLARGFAALRLRDYALVEVVLDPEPAILRAVPNPSLGRNDELAQVAASAGLAYEDLVLSIADEAWERHKEVAVAVKSA